MSSIVWHIIDHYFGQPSTDWITAYQQSRKETLDKANAEETKLDTERAKDSRPSLPLNAYAGEYSDSWYGKVSLQRETDKLILRMNRTPNMIADLQHWQFDTFRAVFRDRTIPDAFVTFRLDPRAKIIEMRMEAVSTLADFSFDYQDLLFRPVSGKSAD